MNDLSATTELPVTIDDVIERSGVAAGQARRRERM